MDKDFHYYGTYIAAMFAGYNKNDSTIIARAAQYVDDCTEIENIKWGNDAIIQTCQSEATIVASSDNQKRCVWSIFHFLPGNLNCDRQIPYEGEVKYHNSLDIFYADAWGYGDKSKWDSKLICQPSSHLVNYMINDTVAKTDFSDKEKLNLIGLRMHVLADTWAHMWFAGTPTWAVNEVSENVYDENNQLVAWGVSDEWATPSSPSFYGWSYLGHGRLGHLPDLPWIKYSYKPHWSKVAIVKNNQQAYLRCLMQMISALKCIRDDKEFNFKKPLLTESQSKIINDIESNIFKKSQQLGGGSDGNSSRIASRIEEWKKIFTVSDSDSAIFGGIPEEYNLIDNVDIYKNFQTAANYHYTNIFNELKRQEIDINESPNTNSDDYNTAQNKEDNIINDPTLLNAIKETLDNISSVYFSTLQSITSLESQANNIVNIDGLQHCDNLTDLNLSKNKIIDVSPLRFLYDLQNLDLSNNNIENIDSIGKLVNLEKLDLGNNSISTVEPLKNLTTVSKINLSNNKISDISYLNKIDSVNVQCENQNIKLEPVTITNEEKSIVTPAIKDWDETFISIEYNNQNYKVGETITLNNLVEGTNNIEMTFKSNKVSFTGTVTQEVYYQK